MTKDDEDERLIFVFEGKRDESHFDEEFLN